MNSDSLPFGSGNPISGCNSDATSLRQQQNQTTLQQKRTTTIQEKRANDPTSARMSNAAAATLPGDSTSAAAAEARVSIARAIDFFVRSDFRSATTHLAKAFSATQCDHRLWMTLMLEGQNFKLINEVLNRYTEIQSIDRHVVLVATLLVDQSGLVEERITSVDKAGQGLISSAVIILNLQRMSLDRYPNCPFITAWKFYHFCGIFAARLSNLKLAVKFVKKAQTHMVSLNLRDVEVDSDLTTYSESEQFLCVMCQTPCKSKSKLCQCMVVSYCGPVCKQRHAANGHDDDECTSFKITWRL